MFTLTKQFEIFFNSVDFYFVDYANGLAEFRTEVLNDEGELTYYKLISMIDDDWLFKIEDEFNQGFVWDIRDIYCRSERIAEITQYDIEETKTDTLFNYVNHKLNGVTQ
jgi:hypothetical protein